MRNKEEMIKCILDFANNSDLVRAVYMNGSRANPNVAKDLWRDYDIVFVVINTKPFVNDLGWINSFGEIAIMQDPNISTRLFQSDEVDISRQYNWLVLFKDHNRIDITIKSVEIGVRDVCDDSLTVVLLDKDNILPRIPASTDKDYYVTKPNETEYNVCVNEFWWCLQNVAKGIVRKQLPYAMKMYNQIVRNMLDYMVDWYIGCENDFSVSVGMWGKYYYKYLSADLYALYEKTYPNANINNIWKAIYTACDLFRQISSKVSNQLGFTYNIKEDENMLKYIDFIKK